MNLSRTIGFPEPASDAAGPQNPTLRHHRRLLLETTSLYRFCVFLLAAFPRVLSQLTSLRAMAISASQETTRIFHLEFEFSLFIGESYGGGMPVDNCYIPDLL